MMDLLIVFRNISLSFWLELVFHSEQNLQADIKYYHFYPIVNLAFNPKELTNNSKKLIISFNSSAKLKVMLLFKG